MSNYENYQRVSRFYDHTRSAGGVEIIRKQLEDAEVPVNQQILVDAGCGTGLYSAALVKDVRRIEAVDMSREMLALARQKMKTEDEINRINFHHSSIDSLPLDDNSADSVIINQVLHHLPDDTSNGWSKHANVFREFCRILKSGGILIINSCSPEQIESGFWFYHLIPDAVQEMKQKVISLSNLNNLLEDCGFTFPRQIVPEDLVLQGDAYFNADGIFDPDWRNGDSIWSIVSEDILAMVLNKVRDLRQTGKLEAYIKQQDQKRKTTGQVTFSIARKI